MSSASKAEALEAGEPMLGIFDAYGRPISVKELSPDALGPLEVVEAIHRHGVNEALRHIASEDIPRSDIPPVPTINVDLR